MKLNIESSSSSQILDGVDGFSISFLDVTSDAKSDGFGVSVRIYHSMEMSNRKRKIHAYALQGQEKFDTWPKTGFLNGTLISECIIEESEHITDKWAIRITKIGKSAFVQVSQQCLFALYIEPYLNSETLHLQVSAWSTLIPKKFSITNVQIKLADQWTDFQHFALKSIRNNAGIQMIIGASLLLLSIILSIILFRSISSKSSMISADMSIFRNDRKSGRYKPHHFAKEI